MKKLGIIIGVILVAFFGVIYLARTNNNTEKPRDYTQYRIQTVKEMASETAEKTDFDPNTIIEANEESGNIPENTEGTGDIVIFEYADYECTHCAEWNTVASKIVRDYPDKVTLVFRGFVLNYNANGVMAAAAANAAAIQGYFPAMKTLLFSNQAAWATLKGDKLKAEFESYFMSASDGKGDVEKFREDMASEAVAKKIAFDYSMGEKIKLTGTPTFVVDGETVSPDKLRNVIEEKVKNL